MFHTAQVFSSVSSQPPKAGVLNILQQKFNAFHLGSYIDVNACTKNTRENIIATYKTCKEQPLFEYDGVLTQSKDSGASVKVRTHWATVMKAGGKNWAHQVTFCRKIQPLCLET